MTIRPGDGSYAMGDRPKGSSSAHTGNPSTRGTRIAAAAPLALYCSVMGVLDVGAGAVAARLVPAGEARALVWLGMTVLMRRRCRSVVGNHPGHGAAPGI